MFWIRNKNSAFYEWLDKILNDFNLNTSAFNFNIYENENDFSIELIATSSFDENDDDWACDEIYASRDNNNEFQFSAKNWQGALKLTKKLVLSYLKNGTYSSKLKNTQAVACGFVDDELSILYKK